MSPPGRIALPAIALTSLLAASLLAAACGPGPGTATTPGASADRTAGAPSSGNGGSLAPSGGPPASASPAITHTPLPPGIIGVAEGDAAAFFQKPNGIAIDDGGDVFVHDSGNQRIVRLDGSGLPIAAFGKRGSGPADFSFQGFGGVAADRDEILVVDNGAKLVKVFAADGTYRSSFGGPGDGEGQFLRPIYVAVGRTAERLRYVTDDRRPLVQVFDRDGAFRFAFGRDGTGPGEFRHPTGIAIAADGTVGVADYELNRVQLFDPRGTFLRQIGSAGGGEGHLAGPDGLAVDAAGRWYVSDTSNHRVDVFAPDGASLGSFSVVVGRMASFPAGLGVAADGSVWVADPGVNVVVHAARPPFIPG
jgi:sugar lactone lactonase YvrE